MASNGVEWNGLVQYGGLAPEELQVVVREVLVVVVVEGAGGLAGLGGGRLFPENGLCCKI